MQGFYIAGTNGSYIELEDGRWADSVQPDLNEQSVEDLLPELTDAGDYPEFCLMTMEELKKYVGA